MGLSPFFDCGISLSNSLSIFVCNIYKAVCLHNRITVVILYWPCALHRGNRVNVD